MADEGGSAIDSSAVTTRIMALARHTEARILVVDDDELSLALVADALQACGLDVRRAGNGLQALEILQNEWFPVVLTDWQMPQMDGIELTRRLRERGVTDTYIIMLTVRDSRFDYEHAYLAGVDDYLTKALPETEVFARIHAAFNTVSLRCRLREAEEALQQSKQADR